MTTTTFQPQPEFNLHNLNQVPLNERHQSMLDMAFLHGGGPGMIRHRFQAEARDLFALAQISHRLHVASILYTGDLRALVEMIVPTPIRPDPNGPLRISPRALLGIIYPHEALTKALPGTVFVRILEPRPVHHGNVSGDGNQVLCLGPQLPAGILLKQLLLMTYGALSMQSIQLDYRGPAGVLNAAAAEWWQQNTQLIPLSNEPFLNA